MYQTWTTKQKRQITVSWSTIIEYVVANAEKIPERPGVYELLVKLQNGNYQRFYVGQAGNLRERFYAHLSADEPNNCIKQKVKAYVCGFRYALITVEADRQDVEQALYDKYSYECNEVRPSGSGRDDEIVVVEQ